MYNYEKVLANNILLKDLNAEAFDFLFDPDACIIGNYNKNTIITQVGEACSSIGFILEGELAIQQYTPSGNIVNIQIMNTGDCIGAIHLLSSKPFYPFSYVSISKSAIVYVPTKRIEQLIEANCVFSRNYITYLSEGFIIFYNKIQMLSEKHVRSRLIHYLSAEYIKNNHATFQLEHTKTDLAVILGVARPSISRELKNMQSDGLIILEGNKITLLDTNLFT